MVPYPTKTNVHDYLEILDQFLTKVRRIIDNKHRAVLFHLLRWLTKSATWSEHSRYLQICRDLALRPVLSSHTDDPIWQTSENLRNLCLQTFANRHQNLTQIRVMIHVPSARFSVAGLSLFRNWIDGLRFLGIAAQELPWGSNGREEFLNFQPTVLVTSDHVSYTEQLDWEFLGRYRSERPFALILTASHSEDGNTANEGRLDKAQQRAATLFVSFRGQEYIGKKLGEWFARGFEVVSIPFSANPLIYYYLLAPDRPLDYVFLASSNTAKVPRYWQYLRKIFQRYRGVINGPGWGQNDLILERDYHHYLYALGHIGINLHIPISINEISELNERTYILAACGAFQLTDRPKILKQIFSEDTIVSADNPAEYVDKFEYYLQRPEERIPFILGSLKCVYAEHTIFHRMDRLIEKIRDLRCCS